MHSSHVKDEIADTDPLSSTLQGGEDLHDQTSTIDAASQLSVPDDSMMHQLGEAGEKLFGITNQQAPTSADTGNDTIGARSSDILTDYQLDMSMHDAVPALSQSPTTSGPEGPVPFPVEFGMHTDYLNEETDRFWGYTEAEKERDIPQVPMIARVPLNRTMSDNPEDARHKTPSNLLECRGINRALIHTRQAFFHWTGRYAPDTDERQSYAYQYHQLREEFIPLFRAQRMGDIFPELFYLPMWEGDILGWRDPVEDELYMAPYFFAVRKMPFF